MSGSPVSLPAGILTQGSSGEPVKQLQLALASAGHSPGPADGVFGLATVRALEAFQRSAGLTADGVYGARTKTALAARAPLRLTESVTRVLTYSLALLSDGDGRA